MPVTGGSSRVHRALDSREQTFQVILSAIYPVERSRCLGSRRTIRERRRRNRRCTLTDALKSWFRENLVLVVALIGQAIVAVIYVANLEARVSILETRGSPHLQEINTRLTVLEGTTKDNKARLDHVIEIMTKRLNINP